ncbi:MAG: SDR family NAD(P)-dependent oxidoreductase, partial [Syntrophobacteraceae bacterium]
MNSIFAKSFILTGAAGGIGRALSLALAAEGCGLVLNGRRTEPLDEIKRECEKTGARVEVVAGSSAMPEVCDALVKNALELGNFYGFIHAAGVLHPGPVLHELPTEAFREIFESSVAGSFQMARAAFPRL